MAVIGPGLRWLERHLFSPALSKDHWNSGGRRLQNIHIPNHLYNTYGLARRHQSVLQKPGRLMAKDGSQKDSRSDKEGFNKEDRVQGIRFRPLFHQDIG